MRLHKIPSLPMAVFFHAVCAFFLSLSNVSAQTAAGNRPGNILLIYADDLGYGDAGCYGSTAIPTPNLDKLAKEGLQFLDAHSAAATCTPSRYSLMTGKYAFRKKGTDILPGDANLIIPRDAPSLPSMLKKGGYATAIVGKWHLGLGDSKIDWNAEIKPGPVELGFDYEFITPATLDRVPCVYLEGNQVLNLDAHDPIRVDYKNPVGNDPTGVSNPGLLKMKANPQHSGTIINGVSRIGFMSGGNSARWVDETMSDLMGDRVVRFMEENKKKPFFIYYAMAEPHVPRIPNPRFAGRTKLGRRGDSIVQLDFEVGKVLAALDRLGLADDTLVIFTSDNGPVLNDGYMDDSVKLNGDHKPAGPYRGGKYDAFEGGTRMPFLVRWPKYVKPGQSRALISQVDLLATLASLTGQPLSNAGELDSVDVSLALTGKSLGGRESVVEQGVGALGLRVGNWKLIQRTSPAKGKAAQLPETSLYDLEKDPGETDNLAAKNPTKTTELKQTLEKIRGKQLMENGTGERDPE